jgi:hypothetical protein
MEVICSSETSIDFQRTIRRYISETDTIQAISCSCEPDFLMRVFVRRGMSTPTENSCESDNINTVVMSSEPHKATFPPAY